MMYPSSKPPPTRQVQPKMRTACDICHHSKVRCIGGNPCEGCQKSGAWCKYSQSNRVGRPKGVRNKRTLENDQARGKGRPSNPHASRKNGASSGRAASYSNHDRNAMGTENGMTFLPTPTSSGICFNPSYCIEHRLSQLQSLVRILRFTSIHMTNFSPSLLNLSVRSKAPKALTRPLH